MTGRCVARLAAAIAVVSLCGGRAVAQETINSASVGGRVTDTQGGVVPGALVSARQLQTNVLVETTSDQDGRFRFPDLKVGPSQIKVHLDGFREVTRQLTLTVG